MIRGESPDESLASCGKADRGFGRKALLSLRRAQGLRGSFTRRLADGGQVLDLAVLHLLIQAADCVLMEVGRCPVVIERRLVLVLLVDEDGAASPPRRSEGRS